MCKQTECGRPGEALLRLAVDRAHSGSAKCEINPFKWVMRPKSTESNEAADTRNYWAVPAFVTRRVPARGDGLETLTDLHYA